MLNEPFYFLCRLYNCAIFAWLVYIAMYLFAQIRNILQRLTGLVYDTS